MNGWWPGKVVNLLMREEGRAMAQVVGDAHGNEDCHGEDAGDDNSEF